MSFGDTGQAEIKAREPKLKSLLGNACAQSSGTQDKIEKILSFPPLDEFHHFPLLPLELRRQIWKLDLPGPRLLMLTEDGDVEVTQRQVSIDRGGNVETNVGDHRGGEWYALNRFRQLFSSFLVDCWRKPSVLFQVCKESRDIALQAYDTCLSISLDPNAKVNFSADGKRPERVDVPHEEVLFHGFYFQPSCDTVWLRQNEEEVTYNIFSVAEPEELKTDSIQSLAISCYDFGCFGAFDKENELLGPARRHFTGLKELIILAENDDADDCDEGYLFTEYRKTSQEKMGILHQSSPDVCYPVVKVLTEEMLIGSF